MLVRITCGKLLSTALISTSLIDTFIFCPIFRLNSPFYYYNMNEKPNFLIVNYFDLLNEIDPQK